MVFILTFLALAGLSSGLGFIFGRRSSWTRRRVTLVAALPIPIIIWSLVLIMVALMSFDPADVCDDQGCSAYMFAITVMIVMGFIAFALGIVFALVGLQIANPKSKDSLHDVFE